VLHALDEDELLVGAGQVVEFDLARHRPAPWYARGTLRAVGKRCWVVLGLWLLLGCAPSPPPAPATPRSPTGTAPAAAVSLTVATGPASAAYAPVWLALEHGYFAQRGLAVSLQTGIGGVNQAQALLAGDLQIGNFGPSELLNARSGGAEVVGLAETIFSPLFELHAPPSITSVEALRGRTVSVTRTGSSNELAARIIVSRHGLTPGQDVTLVQTGDQFQGLAALQSGGVDSGVFSPPTNVKATAAGFPSLTSVSDEGAVLIDLLTVASRAFVDAHPQIVRDYLAAYLDGLREFLTDADATVEIIARYTDSDPDTAREGYRVVLPTIDPRPYIREEGLKTIQQYDVSGRLGGLDLSAAHDDRFLRGLQSAGVLGADGAVAH
jgi:NitT/TauT family transport system substrate-binding protein